MKLSYCRVVTLGLLVATGAAPAATNGFFAPSWRGTANTEAGYWENFSVAVGAPGNLADRPGSTTGAVLTQTDPLGFLTGSLNIYNLDGTSHFTLTDSTPFTLGTVLLQTRSIGAELDYNSMTLSYTDVNGTHTLAPLFRYESDRGAVPGLGATVSSAWQWNLTGLGITDYTISFAASGPSLSFDSLTLDTAAVFSVVPEPTTAALGALGALVWLARKRFQGGRYN